MAASQSYRKILITIKTLANRFFFLLSFFSVFLSDRERFVLEQIKGAHFFLYRLKLRRIKGPVCRIEKQPMVGKQIRNNVNFLMSHLFQPRTFCATVETWWRNMAASSQVDPLFIPLFIHIPLVFIFSNLI